MQHSKSKSSVVAPCCVVQQRGLQYCTAVVNTEFLHGHRCEFFASCAHIPGEYSCVIPVVW